MKYSGYSTCRNVAYIGNQNYWISFSPILPVDTIILCAFCLLPKENEEVVEAALKQNSDRFTLGHFLPSWTQRTSRLSRR